MNVTFSVVGLGKLGASMAAAIASRGFNVIGVDVNHRTVELVNAGRAPVQETNLEETIAANRKRLRATCSHREAILNSDVTFVVVPTPSDDRGAFSLQYAAWAFREIGRALKEKNSYHNVVLTSTVLPGSTRYGLLPILERASEKVCGRDFGLCYSPEFIALGSVIHDFLNPDFVLIGEFDEHCGSQLEACYAQIMENNPPCQRMSIENAELTKIAVNTFVTTKITFANVLADLCERIPGGDIDVVTNALGLDRRIGHKYLKGALGYGGPCFPRDNVALGFIARALGTCVELAEVTDRTNRTLPEKIVERIRPLIHRGATVAILGLAYKPLSHVVEESQGIYLAKALSKVGARVVAYDPLAGEAARAELRDQAVVLDSLKDCLAQADVVLITTPDPIFQTLTAADFNRNNSNVIVVDCWRILSRKLAGHPHIRYIPIGCSVDDEANAMRLAKLWNWASGDSITTLQ
ncbi:MAG: nucleotide sugar dehydrogenase [Anaerolineae bacterium]|nr:nucleotide sugar dehydrogenase [Anaerolineae bacterium]MDW8100539.1 nucleotide sugar dehydrogenase [Anaerolineae bacterium]